MRTLLAAALLAALVHAEPLVEIARARLPAAPAGLASLRVRRAHVPLAVLDGRRREASLALLGADGAVVATERLDGRPLGVVTIGNSCQLALARGGDVSLHYVAVAGRSLRVTSYGAAPAGAWRGLRPLGMTGRRGRATLVCAHDGGLVLLSRPRRDVTWTEVVRSGRRWRSISGFFDAGGDRGEDLYVLDDDRRVLHLEADREGGDLRAARDFAFRDDGVAVRAVAGAPGQLWMGGARRGRATLLRFDPDAPGEIRIRKLEDLFKDPDRGTRRPEQVVTLGADDVDRLEVFDDLLVVCGTQGGRAWIHAGSRRIGVERGSASTLSGARVTAVCVNPSRSGWSLAAATDDGAVHLLRLPGDAAAPDVPDVPADPEPGRPSASEPRLAYFPRVVADARAGLDTVFYLVYLGEGRTRLRITFFDGAGTRLAARALVLERGERARVSVAEAVREPSFDGYAVVSGCARRDLVAEGVLRRGRGRTRVLQPSWR